MYVTQPSGTSFRVDLEQAPEAIDELKRARTELESIKRTAVALGNVDAGSRDSVSLEAARLIGAVADGGPASLSSALTEGIRQIDYLIKSLEADLAGYGRNESATSSRLS